MTRNDYRIIFAGFAVAAVAATVFVVVNFFPQYISGTQYDADVKITQGQQATINYIKVRIRNTGTDALTNVKVDAGGDNPVVIPKIDPGETQYVTPDKVVADKITITSDEGIKIIKEPGKRLTGGTGL